MVLESGHDELKVVFSSLSEEKNSPVSCESDCDNVKKGGRGTYVALPQWQPVDQELSYYLRILLLSNLKSPVRQ